MSQLNSVLRTSLRLSRRHIAAPQRCIFCLHNASPVVRAAHPKLTTDRVTAQSFSTSKATLQQQTDKKPPVAPPLPPSEPQQDPFFEDHHEPPPADDGVHKGYVSPPAPKPSADGSTRTVLPLSRPIGVFDPPHTDENTGADERSYKQRKEDLLDYSKHLQRREELTAEMKRSYFQDFKDMRYNEGKIFVAPTRVFKADKALYFPNMVGRTAASPDDIGTTQVFSGRVSVVGLFSNAWAEQQVNTFTSALNTAKQSDGTGSAAVRGYASVPDTYGRDGTPWTLKSEDALWQHVRINVEDNFLKAWMVVMSMGNIKRLLTEEMYNRYMLVRSGLTEDLLNSIGMLNRKVGFVYLVDARCRIRWAGSGEASEEERQSMVKCLERLVIEEEKRRQSLRRPEGEKDTKKKDESEDDADEL